MYLYIYIYGKQILGAAFDAFWVLKSSGKGRNKRKDKTEGNIRYKNKQQKQAATCLKLPETPFARFLSTHP